MGVRNTMPLLRLLALLMLTNSVVQAFSDRDQVKNGLRSVAASLAPIYLPVSVSPSSPCGRALQDMSASLASNSSWWAANMVDSWGKSVDGSAMFNYHYYGNFDECVHTAADGVTGKYCKLTTFLLSEMGKARLPEVMPWRPDAPLVREMINRDPRTVPTNIFSVNEFLFSTCMPSVCTQQELQDSLLTVLLPLGVWPVVTSCSVLNPPVKFTTPDIGFTAFLTFLVVLVVSASLVDMYLTYIGEEHLTKGGVLRYLMVFSAYTNLGKILQVNPSFAPGTISCLNGLRVLSMLWVIYCHQNTVPLGYMVNLTSVLTALEGFLGQIILNGYPSVDSFFFLSGLLVSYSVLRAAKKTGGYFNVPLFYFHRIIRLLPPICIVVGLVATVLRFLVSGPIATDWDFFYINCQKNWWKDVLFISNMMQQTGDCIGQVWYLGVDMQLYLVAPIIIFPLYRYKTPGKAWLFLVTVLSAIIPAVVTYTLDMAPTMLQGQGDTSDAFFYRYLMPWCRASPWLAGVWLGYILYRQGNSRYKMSPLTVVTGWSLASVTCFLVVFGMYSYNQFLGAMPYDVVTQVAYSGLHRLAWGVALGWMVLACHNGYGGVVNDFLSHPVWQPLSRLTYTTYLVAIPVQYIIMDNLRQPYYFTHLNTVISTVAATFFSIILAACVSLVAESPVLGLERLLLSPGGGGRAAKKSATKITEKDEAEIGALASASKQPTDAKGHQINSKHPQKEVGTVFTLDLDAAGRKGPHVDDSFNANGSASVITSL